MFFSTEFVCVVTEFVCVVTDVDTLKTF